MQLSVWKILAELGFLKYRGGDIENSKLSLEHLRVWNVKNFGFLKI